MITCYSFVFLGSAASGDITAKTVFAIFVLIAWYIHAATTNDYADRHIDAINLKNASDRPLVSKDITYKQLWTIHTISGLIALALSTFYGLGAVILTSVMLVIDYLYSLKPFRISDRGAISQLLLAVAYVFYPISLGYWASGTPTPYPWLLSLGLYLGFVARLFLKDFRDVQGDRKYGKMTFLLRHGSKVTCAVSGALSVISLLMTLYVTRFSFGLAVALVLGQTLATIGLYRLSKLTVIGTQVTEVNLIARTANVSAITILAYYLCLTQSQLSVLEINLIPAVLGIVMLLPSCLNMIRAKRDYV